MDFIIREHLSAAENHQDSQALLKACNLIKAANSGNSTGDIADNFSPDLYVLCAEQALQHGHLSECTDCLQFYFLSNPPQNQFFGRAYLCKAQLNIPYSANNVDDLEKSVVYFQKAVSFGKVQQRYHFLVYNASVIYWKVVRPFLKPGSRHHLIPSLTSIVNALNEIDEADHTWRAQLMMELLECLVDAQKHKEATQFSSMAAEFIKKNVSGKYPELFSKMVHHKLIDSAKAAKEIKGSVILSVIYKIQRLKSLQIESSTTSNVFINLKEIYNLLASVEENISISEKTQLLIELSHLSLELKCSDIATSCIKDLRKIDTDEQGPRIVIECLQCQLEALKISNKIALYTKGVFEMQLKLIRRLESTLQEAIRLAEPIVIHIVCISLWNLCLPLLQHNLRKYLRKPLVSISESLEKIDSLLTVQQCQIHLEIAKIEEDEDHIESAIKHIHRALIFDSGQYQNYLNSFLHRLKLRATLYTNPERLEDRAAMIIEQAKLTNSKDSVRKKRALLVNAGLCLAPDVFQMVLDSENESKVSAGKGNKGKISQLCTRAQHYSKCVQKIEGHLKRIEDKNAGERVKLWADLARVARKQEVWDVCRTACRFCLLYDDGRWNIDIKETGQKMAPTENCSDEEKSLGLVPETKAKVAVFSNEALLLRTLAEIRFINAEATIHLLKSEGYKLNDQPVPPEDTSMRPMGYTATDPEQNPEWIVYRNWVFELSKYATENFLHGAELGVELQEAWITHNAVVYILNHNRHLVSAGRLSELTDTFQKVLTALKKTGHNGNTILLMMLSSALAKGLIQRWIPLSMATKKGIQSGKSKKAQGKGSEKPNVGSVVSIDPSALPDIKLALEVCEFVLDLTNGKNPEEVVPIAVRQQILSSWIKSKQLLQQQIGPKLGTDDEESIEGQHLMTRVLVAVEMHSCNGLGLMDFTVPSLSQVFEMMCQCLWTDPFVELQTLTRLAHFAYNSGDLGLALKCTQKALQFEGKKPGVQSSVLEQEMLSMAACIQGQCIMGNLSGNKHLRLSAIKAFQSSSRFAGEAGNVSLALQAARHFWNACYPFSKSAKEREPLKEATMSVIRAITDAGAKQKQQSDSDITCFHLWPTMDAHDQTAGSECLEDSTRYEDSSDEEQKLRASLYEFLFNIYGDKNEWEAGLKVLDEAIQILPRSKHRLVLFKHRLLVKAKLGYSFFMDILKFKDENEDYLSYIWHHVSQTTSNTSEQLTCYQNAIDALQKPENQWQKIEYLLEMAEWLYCKQFPVSHALNLLDWALDILLRMQFPVKVEEEKGHKGRTKSSRKSAKVKDPKNVEKTENGKTENGVSDPCKSLSDLRNVRQLETLARTHILMAFISGHSSPFHEQHCLIACAYIMQIWQVSLLAAGSFVKILPKLTTPTQNLQSATSPNRKGKKEAVEPVTVKEKPKRKGLVDALPSSTEEWASYDCPDEIRDAYKQDKSCFTINRITIENPTYSLYYLDLLVKELQSISFTHLTLPVLQFAEVIAHDVVQSDSLSGLYHLKILQICTDLRLFQAATIHEKAASKQYLAEQEQISCRQEIAQIKETKKDRMSFAQNSGGNVKILSMNSDGIGINGLSLPYLWMEKADVLIRLGFFQPARLLLSEAYSSFQEIGGKYDVLKCLYLLSVLANCEKNYGQAQHCLKGSRYRKTAEMWYKTAICMTDAVMSENTNDKKQKACKILENAITVLKTTLQKEANREANMDFTYFEKAQHLIKTSGSSSSVSVILLEICDEMNQIENSLLKYGHKEKRAEVMMEHSNILRLLANIVEDEERKHRYYLDAYFMGEMAIKIQEEILLNIQTLFLNETKGVSLPAARNLANIKLIFTELALEIMQLVSTEKSKILQEEKRKGRLCVAVEEFIRSTPDLNSIEQEWKSLGQTLGSAILSQLANVSNLAVNCPELKAKCLYLAGKCLYMLSLWVDPLHPDQYWDENILVKGKHDSAMQAFGDLEQPIVDVQLTSKQDQQAKKVFESNQKRNAAHVYLAQASEILLQSINISFNNHLVNTLSAASLQICSCLGIYDPIFTGQFLALYQSCVASMNIEDILSAATYNTSNSQFAALLHLQTFLQNQGNSMGNLQKSIQTQLSATTAAWRNLCVGMQFFNIFNELPSNFTILVLQHSDDRSFLYGAVLEKPKVNQKGKLIQAKVARCAVNSQKLLKLLEKMELFKQDMMQKLLTKEYQESFNRQQNLFENRQGVHNDPEMVASNNGENDNINESSSTLHVIVDELEEYLCPVLSQLDLSFIRQPSPVLSTTGSVRAKSREKEEKITTSSASADSGDFVLLLADRYLMEFPLEALNVFNEDWISSISRDFSLQLLYNRLHREQTEGNAKREVKSSKGQKQKLDPKKNAKLVSMF
ncbi:hypothetical protein GDO86_013309 [Hymenochirus boettgeri]|uniref:Cilia- and flagella-associated protein 46 n=1 Tax=Hymenochirus boettgeri TaxID=247094 RepID=A0A8T2ITM8_9PIPI|nr:hypothetical protein GDO86_013309 [Hymenochirus boettgeri]